MTRWAPALLMAGAAAGALARPWAGAGSANELTLPASALSAVAGGASAGLVDDASAVAVNPARLGALGPGGVAATWTSWPGGLTDSQVAGVLRFPGFGSGGVHLRILSADVPAASENGDGSFGALQGTVPYRVMTAALAAAPDLTSWSESLPYPLSFGASLEAVRREVDDHAVTGFGATVSAAMPVAPAVTLHLAGRHLGTSAGVAWPMTAAAGATIELSDAWLLGDRLAVAGSAEWSHESGAGGSAVVEYGLGWNGMEAALRAGEQASLVRAASVLPTGGLVLRVARVSLEFGVMPFGQLGTAQIVTLSYSQEPRVRN